MASQYFLNFYEAMGRFNADGWASLHVIFFSPWYSKYESSAITGFCLLPNGSAAAPTTELEIPAPATANGHESSTYGYDHERGGGRGGYDDDRYHGRYQNRAADWADSGFGASNDGPGITQREGLMTYKQFIQVLEDDISPAEAEKRYQEYRTEYITTQKRAYFDLNKNDDRLKDKYHPTNLSSVIDRRNDSCKATAKDFFHDLQNGTLDLGPGITAAAASGSDGNSDDDGDSDKRRKHGRGSSKETDPLSGAPVAHPVSSESRRVQVDIEQALALVRKLDTEKGIVGNILSSGDHDKSDVDKSHIGSMGPIIIIRGLTTVKGLEGVELLDTLLTYLWRIHGVDYYGMSETNEAKGSRHVRADNKTSNTTNINAADWEKKVDTFWQERLRGQDPMVILAAKDKIDAAAVEVLEPYVRKIRDEKYGWKYGCGAKGCTKLFHAPEFVHKHLRLKHPELVLELTSKVREDLYFQNYMNDPNAPGGTPVMQQSAPDKSRHRPGMENRLRYDRANRREYDRAERDGGRYGRGDRSPSRDGADDQMFDAFRGRGPNAPFVPELPAPPILMPVPGAGPLGPFVPAPPEIAMHMLREQGPPPPFEPNGPPHANAGVLGPMMGGPAPIITMPPSFRQDPRRLRSYNDLDAPDEEVTVLDYRSL
uniref:C2H2-type domain-containing protein n=1 Tax=Oryza meridionalis TaxID=40149 RepID=A0A0E0E5W9_9ORYZ